MSEPERRSAMSFSFSNRTERCSGGSVEVSKNAPRRASGSSIALTNNDLRRCAAGQSATAQSDADKTLINSRQWLAGLTLIGGQYWNSDGKEIGALCIMIWLVGYLIAQGPRGLLSLP
jgi:hypothetical protein